MGSLGPAEIIVILVVALIVLGPEKLPDAARQVGRFISEVRRIGSGFQAELKDALDTTVNTTSEPSTTASPRPLPAPGAPPGPSDEIAPQVPPPPSAHPSPPDAPA